jgi:hypothetical protein
LPFSPVALDPLRTHDFLQVAWTVGIYP